MSHTGGRRAVGIALVAVGLLGLVASGLALSTPAWSRSPSMDQAVGVAANFLRRTGNKDLAIDEVMEFQNNFYVVYYERSTGMGAFEMIIDKPGTGGMMRMMGNGDIRPEQGPSMMWNTKYGMMGMGGGLMGMMGGRTPRPRNASATAPITGDTAKEVAQEYLDRNLPGARAEDVHPFYGYYTIHVEKDGRIYGMLSVNSYTGQVWYHNWHGAYIQTRERRGE